MSNRTSPSPTRAATCAPAQNSNETPRRGIGRPRGRGEKKPISVSCKVTLSHYEQLLFIATQRNTCVAAVVREAIERFLA